MNNDDPLMEMLVVPIVPLGGAQVASADNVDGMPIRFVHGSYNEDHLGTPDAMVGPHSVEVPDVEYPGTSCAEYMGTALPDVGGVCRIMAQISATNLISRCV